MKKILILVLSLFLVAGCTNINNSSLETILSEIAASDLDIQNVYRKGYKYYLPTGMKVIKSKEYNEFIGSKNDTFYMYIDLISYLDGTTVEYAGGTETYYFSYLSNEDKKGYIAIKVTQDNKYLVEIVYNYAKIEVMVDEDRIKTAVAEAMTILSSIKYNESFLKGLSEESLLSYKEEAVDIFKKGETADSNRLQYVEDFDGTSEYDVPDYDVIK